MSLSAKGEYAATNPHGVKVGQVWKDNDKRMNRTLKVTSIDRTHAYLQRVGARYAGWDARIRLDRFRPTSTGFVLVKDVP